MIEVPAVVAVGAYCGIGGAWAAILHADTPSDGVMVDAIAGFVFTFLWLPLLLFVAVTEFFGGATLR